MVKKIVQNDPLEQLNWLKNYDYINWKMREEIKRDNFENLVRASYGQIKIELHGSFIKIKNYDINDCPKLEGKLTACTKQGKITWQNFMYDPNEKELFISGGISLRSLTRWCSLDSSNIEDCIDKFNKYDKINLTINGEPRDDIQKEALNFLTNSKQFKSLKLVGQKILALKTGAGKTFCTISSICKLNRKACIIIHNEGLIEQWKNAFLKFTNINEDEIHIIKGYEALNKVIEDKKFAKHIKIFLASHRTLSNLVLEEREEISKLFKCMRVGIKVFDECHKEQKAVNLIDFNSSVKDTWYLTATPGRSDPIEDSIFKFCYDTVPRFGEEYRYSDNYHNIWLVNYNSHPSATAVSHCNSRYGFSQSRYTEYLFKSKKGWKSLSEILFKFLDKIILKEGKIAIILSTNECIEILKKEINDHFESKYTIGIYTTLIKNKKERQIQLENKIILSTEKSLGVGMDVKDLRFLFLFIPTKSEIVTEQILGRLRRLPDKKVYFFDFCDFGFDANIYQRSRRNLVYEKKAEDLRVFEFRDEDTIKGDRERYELSKHGKFSFRYNN